MLLAASHRTPVRDPGYATRLDARLLRQDLFGVVADWRPEPWRVLATVYGIGVGARGGTAERNERFEVGYVQLERTLPAAFTGSGCGSGSGAAGGTSGTSTTISRAAGASSGNSTGSNSSPG